MHIKEIEMSILLMLLFEYYMFINVIKKHY